MTSPAPIDAVKRSWSDWWTEWRHAVQSLVSPAPVFFLVVTLLLGYFRHLSEDHAAVFILTLLLALSASILGAVVWDRWVKLTGRGILVNKGKSAIRGLKLQSRNLHACELRVREYPRALVVW